MKSEAGLSAGIFCFVWSRPTSFLIILPGSAASLPTAAQAGEQPAFAPVAPAAGTLARPHRLSPAHAEYGSARPHHPAADRRRSGGAGTANVLPAKLPRHGRPSGARERRGHPASARVAAGRSPDTVHQLPQLRHATAAAHEELSVLQRSAR